MTEPQNGKKILIVDDEPGIVTYLETLLQDNGYETVSASDGQAGMAKMASEQPDLVTLDISTPETSGVRMYRDLRENHDFAKIPAACAS